MEKYAILVSASPVRRKMIAYQSSKSAVSGFLQRYLQTNPAHTWHQLRIELMSRFSEITDPQNALCLLRDVRQGRDQNFMVFAESLLALATEAFEGQPGGFTAVERQLIGFFTDGLAHDCL